MAYSQFDAQETSDLFIVISTSILYPSLDLSPEESSDVIIMIIQRELMYKCDAIIHISTDSQI